MLLHWQNKVPVQWKKKPTPNNNKKTSPSALKHIKVNFCHEHFEAYSTRNTWLQLPWWPSAWHSCLTRDRLQVSNPAPPTFVPLLSVHSHTQTEVWRQRTLSSHYTVTHTSHSLIWNNNSHKGLHCFLSFLLMFVLNWNQLYISDNEYCWLLLTLHSLKLFCGVLIRDCSACFMRSLVLWKHTAATVIPFPLTFTMPAFIELTAQNSWAWTLALVWYNYGSEITVGQMLNTATESWFDNN